MNVKYSVAANHSGPVSAVALKDNIVLSGAYDGCLGWWQADDTGLALQRLLYLHKKGINCVAASPVGPALATGGSDGVACIVFPEADGAIIVRCPHAVDVECVVFSADGQFLFSGGTDGFGRVFDVKTGSERLMIRHGGTVGAAIRHPDPDLMVTASNDRKLRLVRWSDGKVIALSDVHLGPVKALAVCALGILSTSHDQRLILHDWDLTNPRELVRFPTTAKSMAAEPSGDAVWIGVYDQRLFRYTCSSDGLRLDVETHSPRFWAHGLAADTNFAVVGAFDGAPIVCSREVGSVKLTGRPSGDTVPCISAAFLSGQSVVTAGDSGEIKSADTRGAVPPTSTGSMEGAVTSLASTGDDFIVATWDGVVARFADKREMWRARWPTSLGDGWRAPSPVLRVARHSARVIAGLYTGGWVCFRESDGAALWQVTEATGAVKGVDLREDVFVATGRYDPLRVGDASTGIVRARLGLETPVSDVVVISPFGLAPTRIAVCAGAHEVWTIELERNPAEWTLRVIARSDGHHLPVKALLWLEPDVVLAGDYEGTVVEHRLGQSSRLVHSVNCRLGISSLSLGNDGAVFYTTFDGGVDRLPDYRTLTPRSIEKGCI